ncbi:MAG: glycoside hydrolase family 172 protein [Armatimonadota bacterium]
MPWLPAVAMMGAVALGGGSTSEPTAAQDVTVRSLLSEMADLGRLSRMSEPAYSNKQASSYDRAGKSPTEDWFANRDFGQFVRTERKLGRNEYVMADLKGPGAVVRIWSANPQGTLRFYFDGKELPELVVPMRELLGGAHPDFPPPFSGVRGAGANLYYPIPYRERLVITVDDIDANPRSLYYHVNYREYAPDTPVRTFSLAQVKDAALMAERVAAALTSPSPRRSYRERVLSQQQVIQPGAVMAMRLPDGSGEVRQFRVWLQGYEPDPSAPDGLGEPVARERTLRGVVLDASFDGKTTITCPVGDFFGAAPGLVPYECLPFTVSESTGFLTCRFVMPQREEGVLFFTNHSDRPVLCSVEALWVPQPWTERTLYFHAKWRREAMPTRPMRDWRVLSTSGRGRFVGLSLSLMNPVSTWWGEGDEKIYIDGETFPSTYGTGTEDYFGYAWGSPQVFQHPYHNQPRCDGPGNRGFSSVNRFHIVDDLPFQRSFRFDLEVWHWRDVTVDYAAVAYWYADGESKDDFAPIRPFMLTLPAVPEIWAVPGAIEGESLSADGAPNGVLEVQELSDEWSSGRQLWWRDAAPGDRLVLKVSAEPGEANLKMGFTIARDYGIVRLIWNGKPLGEPLDFYSANLSRRQVDFGRVAVLAENTLEVVIEGSNPAAEPKRHMFGLDYILLERSE